MNPVDFSSQAALRGGAAPDVRPLSARVCTWRGGARAAYSIIHDDVGQPEADGALDNGLPELSQRGLRAGFACVMGDIERRGLWPRLAALVGDRHEVLNHSYDHCNLVQTPDYAGQIDRPQELCVRRLGNFAPRLYAFPYDAFDAPALAHLRARDYAGARAGTRGIDVADAWADDFGICFDTYGPAWSVYTGDILRAHLDTAIAAGGWAVREFHGVEDGSWESISRRDYAAHLDTLVEARRRGALWIDTPFAVLAYRRRRAEAGELHLVGNELRFASKPSSRVRGTLSVELSLEPGLAPHAVQAGRELDCQAGQPGRWLVEVDPDAGPTHVGTRRIGSRTHFSPLETSLS